MLSANGLRILIIWCFGCDLCSLPGLHETNLYIFRLFNSAKSGGVVIGHALLSLIIAGRGAPGGFILRLRLSTPRLDKDIAGV